MDMGDQYVHVTLGFLSLSLTFLLVDIQVGEIEGNVSKTEPEPVIHKHAQRLHRLQKHDVADVELETNLSVSSNFKRCQYESYQIQPNTLVKSEARELRYILLEENPLCCF